jgi:hypothetical protein
MSVRVLKSTGEMIAGPRSSIIITGSTFHPVVSLWMNSGGTGTYTMLSAMSTFFYGLDTDGITYGATGKIKRLNLFCGYSLTDATIPQVKSMGTTTDAITGFVSGDYTLTTGITGSSGKFLNTGVSLVSLQSSGLFAFGVYNRTASPVDGASARSMIGTDQNSIGNAWIGTNGSTTQINVDVANNFGDDIITGLTNVLRCITIVRSAVTSTGGEVYVGSQTPVTGRNALSTSYSTYSIRVFSAQSDGTAEFHTGSMGFYFLANTSMTSTEVSNLHTRVQNFQTEIGRQV